jgi:hypothetical protein
MNGEEMYAWFVEQARQSIPNVESQFIFESEPTVTPGVMLARILQVGNTKKPLLRIDLRPEGVRLHFPLDWQDELSAWLGVPPAEQYRLKSDWVRQPSIGVAVSDFEPYFKTLSLKVIDLLKRQ